MRRDELRTMTSPTESDTPADVRLAAMNLLARREHSRYELRNKLKRRYPDEVVIDEQLDRLVDERLLCDARFAEARTRFSVEVNIHHRRASSLRDNPCRFPLVGRQGGKLFPHQRSGPPNSTVSCR